MIAQKIDALLEARTNLFDDLGVSPGDVEDHRGHRWSGDHGAVWWEDDDGRRHDASVFTREWADRDGLYMVWEPKRQLWLVFSKDREDADFAY